MPRLPIRLYGDPILKSSAKPVETVTDDIRQLAADMFETMDAARGVGLASNQVGVLLRMIVVSVPTGKAGEPPYRAALVNPEVVEVSGQQTGDEGCLSFPSLYFEVKRAKRCKVRALGLDGQPMEVEAEGYLARALLHEIDHLDGVLYFDRITSIRRSLLRGKLDGIRRRGSVGETRGPDE